MKNIKHRMYWFVGIAFAMSVLLTGCGTDRQDVESAYQIYDTTEAYLSGSASSSDSVLELFASDLCVGGTENTESANVIAECAESAAVFQVESGEITYSQNIYEKNYPASTTKILTALIALEYGDLDQLLTVSDAAIDDLDSSSSVCGLEKGDQITLREALYGLMLCSGNDAANVIAENIAGSTEAFADLMNAKAQELGATHSHFVNAHGLPDEDHYTTAYDLYLIFNEAVKNEDFVTIISTTSHEASYLDASGNTVTQTWANTNGYLTGTYEMPEGVTVIGGKTGTTAAAGYCLVLYSTNEADSPIISVVMKGNSRSDMYKIMTQILTNFAN
ncbi:MAG: D-alanyl-D-alanine carboxypeptidase [Clostridiales bacterium]|nr:D-alanyl-D-alanine carboxypeptidase [Clostridiales bacterium]